MKRILVAAASVLFASFSLFAGDVATFDDIGFSDDGKFYIFGEYGKTDKKYEAWAEIYTVNVRTNDFVKGEVYKSKANQSKDNISGKDFYAKFKDENESRFSKYNAKPAGAKTLLYVRESESKDPLSEIVFKDFEGSTEDRNIFYHVKLVPEFEGEGKNCKSKFYISMEKQDENGDVISSYKIGTPDFKRKGITGYQIEKIFTDDSGKNMIFIVQKTMEDSTGISIRYMVEAFQY